MRRIFKRDPDVYIGGKEDTYMKRWWIIPRNRFFNIYLHHFLRSDDDRALHDHHWWNVSILLRGSYIEHTPKGLVVRSAPAIAFRIAEAAHRIQLFGSIRGELPVWTIFITGPRVRDWGFHCKQGWVSQKDFLAPREGNESKVGKGCDQ